jgi:hypothetical protein
MSLVRSALMFAAMSFSISVVMETASGYEGAVERVLGQVHSSMERGAHVVVGLMKQVEPVLVNVASK